MFQRQIYTKLQEWANKPNRKPLILRGARQVGKTTLVEEFSKEFENYIPLNLEKQTEAKIFEQTDSVEEIVQRSKRSFYDHGKSLFTRIGLSCHSHTSASGTGNETCS